MFRTVIVFILSLFLFIYCEGSADYQSKREEWRSCFSNNKMQGDSVKIVSFNVNGVLNTVKRSKILSKLKREGEKIVFLQETQMSQPEHAKLKWFGFKHVFSSSYMSSHKRGVATLISNTVNYEHKSETKDKCGRFVKISGKIKGIELTLISVYAPPGSDWGVYRGVFDMMANSKGVVICRGDFNIRLNPTVDSSGTATHNRPLTKKNENTHGRAWHNRRITGSLLN